jgi:hypothetical protein
VIQNKVKADEYYMKTLREKDDASTHRRKEVYKVTLYK